MSKPLKSVDLKIREGSVHALMGENGAGKSTLMKILYGIYEKDQGEIVFKGKPYQAGSPIEAIRSGISMIPQEISPVPNLDVASNVFLGERDFERRNIAAGQQEKKFIKRRLNSSRI